MRLHLSRKCVSCSFHQPPIPKLTYNKSFAGLESIHSLFGLQVSTFVWTSRLIPVFFGEGSRGKFPEESNNCQWRGNSWNLNQVKGPTTWAIKRMNTTKGACPLYLDEFRSSIQRQRNQTYSYYNNSRNWDLSGFKLLPPNTVWYCWMMCNPHCCVLMEKIHFFIFFIW